MAVPSKLRIRGGPFSAEEPEFSDKMKAWAKSRGQPFLDLVPPFRAAAAEAKVFFDRDIHLTPAGHRVVTNAIAEMLPDLFVDFPRNRGHLGG